MSQKNFVANSIPLAQTIPSHVVEQVSEIQAMPVQSPQTLEKQPMQAPQQIWAAQPLPLGNLEIQQPASVGRPVSENHSNSAGQVVALDQPLPASQIYLEPGQMPLAQIVQLNHSDSLPIQASQPMPVSWNTSQFPAQIISPAQPLPVASENQLKQMQEQPMSTAQPITADQLMAMKQLLPVAHQILETHPIAIDMIMQATRKLQEFQTTSETQPMPNAQNMSLYNLESLQTPMVVQQLPLVQPTPILNNQMIQAQQEISGDQQMQVDYGAIELNDVQQTVSEVQSISESQLNSEDQLNQPLFTNHPMVIVPVGYAGSQPLPEVHPMPVANLASMSQKIPDSEAEQMTEIQPVPVAQPTATNQSDLKVQSMPVNQNVVQVQSISEDQAGPIKSTFRGPTIATNFRCRPFWKPKPVRKPNKIRRSTPAKVENTSKSWKERIYIRIPRIFSNMSKIKKIKLAKTCISIIGPILMIFAVWSVFRLRSTSAVNLPSLTCPKYFQYLSEDGAFYGKMTLFNLSNAAVHVDLIMQLQQSLNNDFIGNLTLYEDLKTTKKTFKDKKLITYRVTFPHNDELPKVLSITVNGLQICAGTNYPDAGTEIKLRHSFLPSEIPVSKQLTDKQNNNGKHAESHKDNTTEKNPLTSTQKPILESRFGSSVSAAECGRMQMGTIPLIFGGIELRRGQMPWLVAIYRKHYTGLQFICGGSLVSSRTVLTAGHCFRVYGLKAAQVLIFLGRHNLENYSEEGSVAREIEKITIHPDYDIQKFPDADLAVMQMKVPVSFNDYIQPICLWSGTENDSFIFSQTGTVAGWGADESGHSISATPKMVETDIVGEVECLRSSEIFRSMTSKRTICAGRRDGTGPCMGDSGGGLMIKRDGRWVIRGIVSAGQTKYQTCNLHEFVIYCDLAKHMTWLQRNLLN